MSEFKIDEIEVIKALPEALLITTDQGYIVYINHALETLTGFDMPDLLEKHVTTLMPQGNRERLNVVSWLARWADNPDPQQLRHLSLEGVTKTGKKLRFRVRVSSFQQNSNSYFLVILQDTTEEYQSTLDLRHAQLVSNRILAIGEDAVITIEYNHTVRYWNKKAQDIFGYSPEEIIGKPFDILVPLPFKEGHKKQVQSFSDGPEASRLMGSRSEIKGLHKDGHIIPLEASITKTTVDGQVLFSAQIRDITKRKQAEQKLKEKESRFRAVFENALEAMALLSPQGDILEINNAAKSMLANEPIDFNQPLWMLDWWGNGSDIESARSELKNNIAAVQRGETIRVRTDLSDGKTTRDIDFSLKAVNDSNNKLSYIIAESRDLSNSTESP